MSDERIRCGDIKPGQYFQYNTGFGHCFAIKVECFGSDRFNMVDVNSWNVGYINPNTWVNLIPGSIVLDNSQ